MQLPKDMPAAARVFEGGQLLQIAMPMGGIGAGCICLGGHGAVQDFSIRNRPATSALPDTITGPHDCGFALLHVRGERPVTRLLEGPLPEGKVYDQSLQAQGYRHGGYEGLPRFERCRFVAAYPFGRVELNDAAVPISASVTGWSPLVPLDDRASGMPCAILEYRLTNGGERPVEFDFSYHLSHLPRATGGWRNTRNRPIDGGVLFYNTVPKNDETFGTATLTVLGHDPAVKAMWTRGGWFDWIASLWAEASAGDLRPNAGNTDRPIDGHNGGSVMVRGTLAPGASTTVPIVIAWHVPNVYLTMCQPGETSPWWLNPPPVSNVPAGQGPAWRPWYAGQWPDAAAVAAEVRANFDSLRSRTVAFRDALFGSTLPPEVIDAVASNLAILKSPTVLRQENGNLWGWEGCFTTGGCCPGSCTHVWNYAQALPHLFPQLERTLREQEYERSLAEDGSVNFRSALPDGPAQRTLAAADGQLGGIMKLYRDWQIGGDAAWLARLYPHAKRSLDYCIRAWDPDRRGGLFEPHHNTYDIEFWGPDGMCTSVYVGALSALAEMGRAVGDPDAPAYADLAARAAAFCDQHLFNGEFYQQRVEWRDAHDRSFAARLEQADTDPALTRVLRDEGPPYQYGDGCLSDGVIGAWLATQYGIDLPLDRQHVRSTLAAIFKHNFRPDLWGHACTQRPGYAVGHEPGLILCTWPNGGRPTLPFVYSDEVWTGVEHQVASHLISVGLVDEGLTIVRAVRSRYAGDVRNPFNEYECGSYYARAMASYALLAAASGFRYSQVDRTLWLSPRLPARPWRSLFAAATGYGVVKLDGAAVEVELLDGTLAVDQLVLGEGHDRRTVRVDGTAAPGRPLRIAL
jgi:uncharacterized protein (DUF608 family)